MTATPLPTPVDDALAARSTERPPEARLDAVRRALDLLGDPHRASPVVPVTRSGPGSATGRVVASLLWATRRRVGLLAAASGELAVDGCPVSRERVAACWPEVEPALAAADLELTTQGRAPLTRLEAATLVAFAVAADLGVDVLVVDGASGGAWDPTSVADGRVVVVDHVVADAATAAPLDEVARVEAGLVTAGTAVVSAEQDPEALAALQRAVASTDSTLALAGIAFGVEASVTVLGGQLVTIRGTTGRYDDLLLPLAGEHGADDAALAIAAVEAVLGCGLVALDADVVADGLTRVAR